MQRNSDSLTSHSFIAAFLQELAARDDSFKTLLEESVRRIVREEIEKQFNHSGSGKIEFQNSIVFDRLFTENYLPFPKWKKDTGLYLRLMFYLLKDKYVTKSKQNYSVPHLVKNYCGEGAIVWLQSIPKLIYLIHHLIHTYDSVAVSDNLKKLLWENILFTGSNSRVPEHANFKSFLTLWSRIEREITHKQRIHHEIDDLLYDVFNEKEV